MIYLKSVMKKIIRHISTGIRYFVICTIVFSIVANGAFAGQRVEKAEQNSKISLEEAKLIQGPLLPDELPNNMKTSRKPDTEQSAYLKAPQISKTDNNQSRYKLHKEHSKQILKEFLNSHKEKSLISSISQVHSDLGRQFRLVGAKPSGTS